MNKIARLAAMAAVLLGPVLLTASAQARTDEELQGPSLNGTLFQAPDSTGRGFEIEAADLPDGTVVAPGSAPALREREKQGPSLNGILFQASGSSGVGFQVESVELQGGIMLRR